MHDVSGQDASLASGLESTAQQVGGAVGLAVLATLALRHTRAAMAHGVAAGLASTHGTVLALRVAAVVALVGAAFVATAPIARPRPKLSGEAEVPASDETPAGLVEPAPA
jgi:hypothetical protein